MALLTCKDIHYTVSDRHLLRGCLWKWNRTEKGRALIEYEIGFVVKLVIGRIMEHHGGP